MQTKPSVSPIPFYLFLFSILILTACDGNYKNTDNANKSIGEGMVQSIHFTELNVNQIYHSLVQRLTDPINAEKAKIWEPKAATIKKLSDDVIACIDGIKELLNKDAEPNKAVKKILYDKEKGMELFAKMITYRRQVLNVDSNLYKEFFNTTLIINLPFDSLDKYIPEITDYFFENGSTSSALNILSQFHMNIRVAEGRLTFYCLNKCNSSSDDYSVMSAIVAQNTNHLKAGEELEITAGVGEFSRTAKPEITIDGKPVTLSDGAVGNFTQRVTGKPGDYKMNVIINYTDQYDGVKKQVSKKVKYSIVKE